MVEKFSITEITLENILKARKQAKLTQKEAALLVGSPSYRTWQDWERGVRSMRISTWELFLLKTDQLKNDEILTTIDDT